MQTSQSKAAFAALLYSLKSYKCKGMKYMGWKNKVVVCIIGVVIALLLMPAGYLHYEMNSKKTIRDTTISPDKVYELTLIEIGEPTWPFGSASGRLVLKEGYTIISQTDFELRNDGCSIGSNDWAVTWNEDYVEVILSGEEQFDEQIVLYYDGTSQRQSLTLETGTTVTQPEVEIHQLDIAVMENRENEFVFDISMADFIESYNSLYFRDKGSEYLLPKYEWRKFTYDDAIHSDHETSLLEFTVDERIWSQPTITVYVPTNADYIQEITVNFDEHGYSESFYAEFEELCFYTLKVFFPDMPDKEIIALYEEANHLGNMNVFLNENGYKKGCAPCVLYHKDGIGIYPYFAIGEWVHLCIIPVTQEIIDDYAQKGVEIREIE